MRIGKFRIPSFEVMRGTDIINRIMSSCVIIRAEMLGYSSEYEYYAYSDMFDSIGEGDVVPEYDFEVSGGDLVCRRLGAELPQDRSSSVTLPSTKQKVKPISEAPRFGDMDEDMEILVAAKHEDGKVFFLIANWYGFMGDWIASNGKPIYEIEGVLGWVELPEIEE